MSRFNDRKTALLQKRISTSKRRKNTGEVKEVTQRMTNNCVGSNKTPIPESQKNEISPHMSPPKGGTEAGAVKTCLSKKQNRKLWDKKQ